MPFSVEAYQLELRDATSDKFYRVFVFAKKTMYQWGRRGTFGQVKLVTHGSRHGAHLAGEDQGYKKRHRGYEPVSPHVTFISPSDDPTAMSAAFEAAWVDYHRRDLDVLRRGLSGSCCEAVVLTGWNDASRSHPPLLAARQLLDPCVLAYRDDVDAALLMLPPSVHLSAWLPVTTMYGGQVTSLSADAAQAALSLWDASGKTPLSDLAQALTVAQAALA